MYRVDDNQDYNGVINPCGFKKHYIRETKHNSGYGERNCGRKVEETRVAGGHTRAKIGAEKGDNSPQQRGAYGNYE